MEFLLKDCFSLNNLYSEICRTKMLSHNFTALHYWMIYYITIHNITRLFIVTINVTWTRDLSGKCKSVLSRHNKSVTMTLTSPRPSVTPDPAPAPLNGPTGLHWSWRHRRMSPETQKTRVTRHFLRK